MGWLGEKTTRASTSYGILNDLKKLRDNAAKKILDILNLILSEYSAKNSISLIIDKKNIIIGKSELDVTNQIMDLLNKKIKKVDLK